MTPRLTPAATELERFEVPKAHVAKEMGVSRKTVAHWVGRFATECESGLRDRSSRPLSSPTRTSPQLEQQVVQLRRQTRRGQDWIGSPMQ